MTHKKDEGLTRREAMAAGLATALVASARAEDATDRLPAVFLPHGGGPWPFVDAGWDTTGYDELTRYLKSIKSAPKKAPKALLVISAHWEETVPTVMTAERPPLLYDYSGFPEAAYSLEWKAPGDPKLAARVQALLGAAGMKTASDAKRGFDHGTFVPLKLTYPEAEVPAVQLSLKTGLDPEEHLAIGRALAPLRDEGVFLVGSGMTYHNMRGFGDPRSKPAAEEFDAWLRETATSEPGERDKRLAKWASAPKARACHPREEHLLPLMVIAGAAGKDRGKTTYNGEAFGVRLSGYQFG
jgi:aromatic ring-opening dioxygenase catalytic subunit (LigB family)